VIGQHDPATLNEVAAAVGRGAPAVSRAVDTLVRSGLVERTQDPDNRRRLALRLTDDGREELTNVPRVGSGLEMRLERLAQSELRAIERAIEILERASCRRRDPRLKPALLVLLVDGRPGAVLGLAVRHALLLIALLDVAGLALFLARVFARHD